jgi:hypothetical protein
MSNSLACLGPNLGSHFAVVGERKAAKGALLREESFEKKLLFPGVGTMV